MSLFFHGRGCDCDDCYNRAHPTPGPDTLCHCCGEQDDRNGNGPAINTGYCEDCNSADCPNSQTAAPCQAGRARAAR